jgi:transcription elongation GreA/GreB family factor
MDKSRLRQAIVDQLLAELDLQTRAAHMAREEATSEESKAENKYDTRGQEAAYLAEGQARLAAELHETIAVYRGLALSPAAAGDVVSIGHLATLSAGSKRIVYFLGPRRGGLEVTLDGVEIIVLTPQSPVGRQLLGKRVGDTVQLPSRGAPATYRIVAIE